MCTGTTIALYAMAAGAAISAYSSIQQGEAAKEAANEQAKAVAQEAGQKQDAAQAHADKIRKAARGQRGEAKAALAKSGVKLGEGTALEVDESIAQAGEEDALSALLTGKRIGRAADQEAGMLIKSGQNAASAGYMKAAGTVLGAAGTVASGWKTTASSTNGADAYNGTWTADGKFDSRTYNKQIWD